MWILSVVLALAAAASPTSAAQHHVYWNSSNPIFAGGGEVGLSVATKDRVILHCPSYGRSVEEASAETSVLFLVEASAYAACRLGPGALAIGQCRQPFAATRLALAIRSFTPLPNAPEFRPGQEYFLVSTSTGAPDGVHQRDGGLCRHRNLRLRLHVRERDALRPLPATEAPATSTPAPASLPPSGVAEAAAAAEDSVELEAILERLRKPKRTRGSWWNPSSAPDYVPLEGGREATPAEETVYRVEARPTDLAFWEAPRTLGEEDGDRDVLWSVQEGEWAASHAPHSAAPTSSLPCLGFILASVIAILLRQS